MVIFAEKRKEKKRAEEHGSWMRSTFSFQQDDGN
jgi:hypothetical protein